MKWFHEVVEYLKERLFEQRSFFYPAEQYAYERRREQIQQNAYFSCRRPRE